MKRAVLTLLVSLACAVAFLAVVIAARPFMDILRAGGWSRGEANAAVAVALALGVTVGILLAFRRNQ